MNRRKFLAAVGATSALAGCSSVAKRSTVETSTTAATDTAAPTTAASTRTQGPTSDVQLIDVEYPDPLHVGEPLSITITLTNEGEEASGGWFSTLLVVDLRIDEYHYVSVGETFLDDHLEPGEVREIEFVPTTGYPGAREFVWETETTVLLTDLANREQTEHGGYSLVTVEVVRE